MKYLIFDSSCLINFASNSLLSVLRALKKDFPGEFLITKTVKYESIDHPLKVQRFEWGALRIQELLKDGVIKLSDKIVNPDILKKEADKILEDANNVFFAENKPIHLIDEGEAECLALSKILSRDKKENVIVVDERTTRILCEKPENLQKLMAKKLHTQVKADKSLFKEFRGFDIIRSTELGYIAFKKDLIYIKDKKTLEAVTYALKFGGCSISEKEALAYKQMK